MIGTEFLKSGKTLFEEKFFLGFGDSVLVFNVIWETDFAPLCFVKYKLTMTLTVNTVHSSILSPLYGFLGESLLFICFQF